MANLEQRIKDAEQEKLTLEKEISDAFSSRDHRKGRRVQRQLDRLTAQINDLYEKWFAAGSENAQ